MVNRKTMTGRTMFIPAGCLPQVLALVAEENEKTRKAALDRALAAQKKAADRIAKLRDESPTD